MAERPFPFLQKCHGFLQVEQKRCGDGDGCGKLGGERELLAFREGGGGAIGESRRQSVACGCSVVDLKGVDGPDLVMGGRVVRKYDALRELRPLQVVLVRQEPYTAVQKTPKDLYGRVAVSVVT